MAPYAGASRSADRRRRRDVNRTVNPEAQVADRVASLLGTTLTEEGVHRFLLDAADILGTESFAAYGPELFFRWACGDRYVEVVPNP